MRSLKDKGRFKTISTWEINNNYNKLVGESNKAKLTYTSLKKLDKILEKKERQLQQKHIRKISSSIMKRVHKLLKNENLTSLKLEQVLGCNIKEFKEYISSKFVAGMTWDNHSQYGWHLDHIIPISSAKNDEEILLLSHYTNFQPLWAEMNLSKHDKHDPKEKEAYIKKRKMLNLLDEQDDEFIIMWDLPPNDSSVG